MEVVRVVGAEVRDPVEVLVDVGREVHPARFGYPVLVDGAQDDVPDEARTWRAIWSRSGAACLQAHNSYDLVCPDNAGTVVSVTRVGARG